MAPESGVDGSATSATPAALAQLPRHERLRILALDGVDHDQAARRRLDGEPLQYIEGTAAFTDFDVRVDERVLVPRPETEGLFELVVAEAPNPRVIVDLGTGSGVLAIALARRFDTAEVHAVDRSPGALELARANAADLGVSVHFHLGDLFAPLPGGLAGGVDLLVSNPPYVREDEWQTLPVDVRHEPREALIAGPLGTEMLARIAGEAGPWLASGAIVACEIGEDQGPAVTQLFGPLGEVRVVDDLARRPRYVWVRTPG